MNVFFSPRTLFAAAMVLTAAAHTAFGATLRGHIQDASGGAIPKAQVAVFSRDNRLRLSVFTDEAGAYVFENLPAGEYLVEASAPGLTRQSARAAVAEAASVDFTLAVSRVETKVIVTANGLAQSGDEVAKAVDVIHADLLQARGEFSLSEAIQTLPGLRVQSLGGPGSFTRILSRGLRAQDTAVTVDGLRFRDAGTTQGDASPFLENLLVVNADRVEVLRGTGSSIYGSNAIGGVVNVVTDEGGGPLHGQVLADGGGLGMYRGLAKIAGGAFRERLRYSGGVQHINVTGGVDGFDPFRSLSGQAYAQVRPSASTSLSARLWAGDTFVALNDTPYAAPSSALPPTGVIRAVPVPAETQRLIEARRPFTFGAANFVPNLNDPDGRRSSRFLTAALVFTQRLHARASWRASYQRVETRRDFRDGPAGVRFEPLYSNSSRIHGDIDTAEARADVELARWNTLSGGYEFEREQYRNLFEDFPPPGFPTEAYDAKARQRSHGAFFHNQSRLLDNRLQISLSGRVQLFRLEAPEFRGGTRTPPYQSLRFASPPAARTGDAAIAYMIPRTGTKLRAHAGNGYRSPAIFERLGALFFDGLFSPLGDPRLRPERTAAFDWGVDQYLAGQKLRLSATHFYTSLQEVISFDFSGFLDPASDPYARSSGYINTGGGLARGVELSAEVSPVRGTRVLASYTYTNSDQRRSTVRDNDFFKVSFISDHQFTIMATQRLTRRLDVAFDLWMVSEHPTILSRRAFLVPGARKADLVVNYTVPVSDRTRLRFYGKLNNAFDSQYLENGFRTPGLWSTAGMNIIF